MRLGTAGTCIGDAECRSRYYSCGSPRFRALQLAVLFGAMIQTGNKRQLVSPEREPGVGMRGSSVSCEGPLFDCEGCLQPPAHFVCRFICSAIEVSVSKSVCHICQTLSKHSGPCFLLPEETLALRRLVSPERDPGVGMRWFKCVL